MLAALLRLKFSGFYAHEIVKIYIRKTDAWSIPVQKMPKTWLCHNTDKYMYEVFFKIKYSIV